MVIALPGAAGLNLGTGMPRQLTGRACRTEPAPEPGGAVMATARQKEAAKRNIEKAREALSARAHGAKVPRQGQGMSTAEKDKLPDKEFAFPKERKEPLTDARHIRNAIARFDQVEGVTDAERDQAWKRIQAAAKRYGVEVSESSWRDLASGGNDSRR